MPGGVPVCLECGEIAPENDQYLFIVSRDDLLGQPEVTGGVTHRDCAEAFEAKLGKIQIKTRVEDSELQCPQCHEQVIPGKQAETRGGEMCELNRCANCDLPLKRQPGAQDNRWRKDEQRA